MKELTSNINEIIDECLQKYKEKIENGSINEFELKKDILNRVKISLQEDFKIDLLANPKKEDLKFLEKTVDERIKPIFVQDELEISELDSKTINKFEKEMTKIQNLEKNGNHKSATSRSGRLISNIKKEIKRAKNNENLSSEEEKLLKQLEELLDNQLEWHKGELATRYKKEFLKKPATFKAIVTTLPHGIGLQAKKIANCINQLKEAKTNKERIFKVMELGKETGLFAATPVIFTTKFIVKHWYLILLLLMLLRLPGLNFNHGTEKKPEVDMKPSPEISYELDPEGEIDLNPITDPTGNPVVVDKPDGIKIPNPIPKPVLTPGVNMPVPMTDTGTGTPVVKPETPIKTPKPILTPGVNMPVPMTDTGTGTPVVKPETPIKTPKPILTPGVNMPVPITDTGTGTPVTTTTPVVDNPEIVSPIDIIEQVEVTSEQQGAINELVSKFLNTLENDYKYVIISRHPDITVVHSPEEFLEAVHKLNPDLNISDPEFFYSHNIANGAIDPIEKPIIWPELESTIHIYENEQELINYIQSGKEQELTDYFNNFIANDGKGLLEQLGDMYNSSAYAEFMKNIGISGGLSIFLFGLYEVVQYGVVPEISWVLPY